MHLTVNEACSFGGLKECKLLAGESGLDRIICCVDSMEIPDISQWLQQGEFLVTTGYALKENAEALVQVIEALAEKNGSGLALKTRFIGEVSQLALKRAEELGIPVFEMPAEMPTINLTEPLVRRVIADELQNSSRKLTGEQLWHQQANFYMELALGIIKSEKEAYYRAKFLKLPQPPFSLVVFDMDSFREQVENMPEAEIMEIKQRTEKILRRVLEKNGYVGVLVGRSDSFACILKGDQEPDALKKLVGNMKNAVQAGVGMVVTAGIVEQVHAYLDIREAHECAVDVIEICRIGKQGEGYACLSEVLLERAVRKDGGNPYLQEFVKKYLGVLEECDACHHTELVHTAQVLVDNMGIRTKTAEALFLHRNSLLRRLQKIEMLTGLNLSDGNCLLQLGIALKIRPYVGDMPII